MRIAEATYNTAAAGAGGEKNGFVGDASSEVEPSTLLLESNGVAGGEGLGLEEKKVLDRIGEALARLGRVKRVGLGVREKIDFVRAWTRKRR